MSDLTELFLTILFLVVALVVIIGAESFLHHRKTKEAPADVIPRQVQDR